MPTNVRIDVHFMERDDTEGETMRGSKHLRWAVLGALLIFALASTGAHAEPFGARSYGMGGASTGVSDNLAGLIYNPALLSKTAFQVGLGLGASDFTEAADFFSNISDPSEFEESAHLRLVSLSGVSIAGIGAGFAVDGTLDVDATCDAGLCAEGEYMSQILFSLGRNSASLPMNLMGLHLGGTVKRLDGRRISFTSSKPLVEESEAYFTTETEDWKGEGYSFSLSAALAASDMITIGFAAHDIVSSLSWTGTKTSATHDLVTNDKTEGPSVDLDKYTEKLTPVYRAGISFKPPIIGLVLAADASSDGVVRYGVEKNLLLNLISLRAGQIQAEDETTTTLGLGINLGPAHVDAAVGSTDGFETFTSMVEASVRF